MVQVLRLRSVLLKPELSLQCEGFLGLEFCRATGRENQKWINIGGKHGTELEGLFVFSGAGVNLTFLIVFQY